LPPLVTAIANGKKRNNTPDVPPKSETLACTTSALLLAALVTMFGVGVELALLGAHRDTRAIEDDRLSLR